MQYELTHTCTLIFMWGENWVVSFWLWGVWICMMAVGFSSGQAWCRTTTHYLWTHCLSQVFITAPVCLCVCVCIRESRRVVADCQINNLAEHFSTGLRVCASLIGSQAVHQKRASECFTGTRKQSWIVAYNFWTMPIENFFSFVVILLYVGYVHCLYAFLNGPKYKCVCECQWNRLADLEESILSDVKRLPFLSFSFFRALLETKL